SWHPVARGAQRDLEAEVLATKEFVLRHTPRCARCAHTKVLAFSSRARHETPFPVSKPLERHSCNGSERPAHEPTLHATVSQVRESQPTSGACRSGWLLFPPDKRNGHGIRKTPYNRSNFLTREYSVDNLARRQQSPKQAFPPGANAAVARCAPAEAQTELVPCGVADLVWEMCCPVILEKSALPWKKSCFWRPYIIEELLRSSPHFGMAPAPVALGAFLASDRLILFLL